MYLKAPMGAIAIDYRALSDHGLHTGYVMSIDPSHFKATFCLLDKNSEAPLAFSMNTEKENLHPKLHCLSEEWPGNTENVSRLN